ncbi:hypothetical protein JQS43_21865 [Natronosporangium hydrolyticum]|uniref:Uncharacterized protein n=1 Tax=Natronosporangium hydrolyticum TaxID=2811111 RepID=A0A895YFF5_9ACTN|nr:hypothetical protein [Natronosporangium hydrolyticum]QSB14143.1 hypothetical protein JQS43_21865 [Natronosporangium hydrolyticum]
MGKALLVVLARSVGFVSVVVAWSAFVWFTGRTWSHRPRRRYVTRRVRATGNWLLTVVAAALLWQPAVTAAVLAVAGGVLVATAAVTRRRAAVTAAGGPIRVRAEVGTPRRLAASGSGR